jgi:hypothetical protein
MKQLLTSVLLLFVLSVGVAEATTGQKIMLTNLEDFFRFENVQQLESRFGKKNVFTEKTFYGNPADGGPSYLVSQVKFNTPQSVLVIWNEKGNLVCGVQTSAYAYDGITKKAKLIPNNWKTKQGVYAGMNLSLLVRKNLSPLTFYVQSGSLNSNYGTIILKNERLKSQLKVPFSTQKLIYVYTLDLKGLKEFFPELKDSILKSNHVIVKKMNPILDVISIYREGLKPQTKK